MGVCPGAACRSPLSGVGSGGQFAIGMLEDITDLKLTETRMRDYQEKLRSVALEPSVTEERERRRLATDLHDHVGQIMALAQIKLAAVRRAASANLAAPMDEVLRLINQTIDYTRSLTFELSPPILYDLGFEAAVEVAWGNCFRSNTACASRWRRTGIPNPWTMRCASSSFSWCGNYWSMSSGAASPIMLQSSSTGTAKICGSRSKMTAPH